MDYFVKKVGMHRGAPRLYFDTGALRLAGFSPGTRYSIRPDPERHCLVLEPHAAGERVVARKARGVRELPVIDINSRSELAMFAGMPAVRIVLMGGALHILALASHIKASERVGRLLSKLACNAPLATASLSFGAGMATAALHAGLAAGGVPCRLSVANELEAEYLELARANHPGITAATTLLAAPMQEVAADDWLLSRLPRVEILEAGLPCSGASRAGIAKRHLAKMEDHPHVGHLVASAILLIARLQPAVVLLENVPAYADTASAAILRAWFKDAGYKLAEATLSAQAFGSPEKRTRWFLVAFPAGFELDLSDLLPEVVPVPVLADFLEAVPDDDERYREVAYLAIKAERDAEAGKGFKQQFMHPTDAAIPTLRKGYAKGGSTDPRLVHPSDPARSRLLTSREHARIKGIDESMLNGAGEALGHQVCGQSVDARPVMAIGRRIAGRMRAWCSGRAAGAIGADGVAAVGDVPTWASVVG